ncbi:HPP family protein [Pararobbsia silviterrae]|uniref:HPP family protein n=1 Tax=Pararobbsia silviterrae TaxID=1792498 RepID=A0A494XDN5_9BURK|nr:HPP family protein [Pararobbsia silviterrae]RKP47781.1 HPP family protein [Pararobbsia silviterrae]
MSLSTHDGLRGTHAPALFIGGSLTLFLLGGLAKIALITGVLYLLFPELAALSYEVFVQPAGAWARAPFMLAVTPAVTAAIGTGLAQTMRYGLTSVAISIAAAVLIVRLMRSPIAPAVSAGFLPMVFGITSGWYPVSIAVVTCALAIASLIHRRARGAIAAGPTEATHAASKFAGIAPPVRPEVWLPVFAAFLLLAYGLATVTGLRLVLFPPLVVIALELFAHANARAWAKRPLVLPIVCTIAASAGVAMLSLFGLGTVSVVTSLLIVMVTMRVLRLHFPPALAISLLPQMLAHPDWHLVPAVLIGTTTLVAVFLLARPLLRAPRDAMEAC